MPAVAFSSHFLIRFLYTFPSESKRNWLYSITIIPNTLLGLGIIFLVIRYPNIVTRELSSFGYYKIIYHKPIFKLFVVSLGLHLFFSIATLTIYSLKKHGMQAYLLYIYGGVLLLSIGAVTSSILPLIGLAAYTPLCYFFLLPAVFLLSSGIIQFYQLEVSYNNRLVFISMLLLAFGFSLQLYLSLSDFQERLQQEYFSSLATQYLGGDNSTQNIIYRQVDPTAIGANLKFQYFAGDKLSYSDFTRSGNPGIDQVTYSVYVLFQGKFYFLEGLAEPIRKRVHEAFSKQVLLAMLLCTVLYFLLPAIWRRWLTQPVNQLAVGFEKLSQGNYDVNLASSGRDELGKVTLRFNDMVKELKRNRELEIKSERVQAEVDIARDIQNNLVTQNINQQVIELAASDINRDSLTGDFFGFVEGDNTISGYICDVSGSGLPAAHFMLVTHSILKICSNVFHHPALVLEESNRHIYSASIYGMHATSFFFRYNYITGTLNYSSAGHWDQIIFRGNGEEEILNTKGPPLGVGRNPIFQEKATAFEKNDLLFLYTDGIFELTNSNQEMVGIEKIKDLIRKNLEKSAEELNQTLKAFLGSYTDGSQEQDDQTYLLLRPAINAGRKSIRDSYLRSEKDVN